MAVFAQDMGITLQPSTVVAQIQVNDPPAAQDPFDMDHGPLGLSFADPRSVFIDLAFGLMTFLAQHQMLACFEVRCTRVHTHPVSLLWHICRTLQ
jgi:hypothetical protein